MRSHEAPISPWPGIAISRPAAVVSRVAILLCGLSALGGCINVKAPDKPIVIELNVNIRQEVVYRLAQDAQNTIESNPEIF